MVIISKLKSAIVDLKLSIFIKKKYIYDKLIEWIDKGNNLGDSCHWFKSKMDVDIWFHDNLKVELKIDIE